MTKDEITVFFDEKKQIMAELQIRFGDEGKKDGRSQGKNIPIAKANSILHRFQDIGFQLKAFATNRLTQYEGEYNAKSKELKAYTAQSANIKQKKEKAIEKEIIDKVNQLEIQHRKEEADLYDNIEDLKKKIINRKNDLSLKNETINSLKLDNTIDPRWAFVWIFILTFLELPFTYQAFLVLRTTPIVSLSIAILLSIILAFSAHFVGASLKARKDGLVSIPIFIISLLSIQVAAHFRTLHAQGLEIGSSSFFATDDIFFLIIGGGIYFICAAISYFAHTSDINKVRDRKRMRTERDDIEKNIQNLEISVKEINKNLKENQRGLKEEKKQLHSNLQGELKRIDSYEQELQNEINKIKNTYNSELERFKSFENNIVQNYKEAISRYQTEYFRKHGIQRSQYTNVINYEKEIVNAIQKLNFEFQIDTKINNIT